MNSLMIFNNPEFGEIRTVEIDGEAWFVGTDIAKGLGYKDPHSALKQHVDDDDKGVGEIPTPGGKQKMTIINEVGMYALGILSELPGAKKFRRWITKEVIPSIVKTGSYQLPALSSSELILKIAESNVELERRVLAIEEKEVAREEKLDNALQILSTSGIESWQGRINKQLNALNGGRFSPNIRKKLYDELEGVAGVSLDSRLGRLRNRLRKKSGATYREVMKLSKLDVISRDKHLMPIFESVLKKHQAIHCMSEQLTIVVID